jgi:membrane protein DedA with SNARE-associated domain
LFGGLSELNVKKTVVLATISALVWNSFVIYLGILFGHNIELVDSFLSTYSDIAIILTILVIVILILKYFWGKKKKRIKQNKI